MTAMLCPVRPVSIQATCHAGSAGEVVVWISPIARVPFELGTPSTSPSVSHTLQIGVKLLLTLLGRRM